MKSSFNSALFHNINKSRKCTVERTVTSVSVRQLSNYRCKSADHLPPFQVQVTWSSTANQRQSRSQLIPLRLWPCATQHSWFHRQNCLKFQLVKTTNLQMIGKMFILNIWKHPILLLEFTLLTISYKYNAYWLYSEISSVIGKFSSLVLKGNQLILENCPTHYCMHEQESQMYLK